MWAGRTLGQNLRSVLGVPRVGAFGSEQLGNDSDAFVGDIFLAAVLAEENRNRYTPGTLARNAPVAAVLHHRGHAVLAPAGNPVHLFDGLNRLILKLLDRAEPLFGGAEKNWLLAAPAVRILVNDMLAGKQ
ncbi:hypothetical protein DSECCO2_652260 [anaerobic digester metagenome]